MSSSAGEESVEPFKLPGFGLPFNFIPRKYNGDARDLFRNALHGQDLRDGAATLPLTTLREFTMLRLMNEFTDKPNWHQQVFDETIMSSWKADALLWNNGTDVSEQMVDWCIAELRYKAKIFDKTDVINVYNGGVMKSDTAVSDSLKEALKAAAAPLEQVPARDLDWHPGSDGVVLNLVDPSFFPLTYGRTRVLPDSVTGLDDCIKRSGEGVIIPVPPEDHTVAEPKGGWWGPFNPAPPFSRQFQWLPCDVDLPGGEDKVKIKSYINNLHPTHHEDLYRAVEDIISRTIPLWNMALTILEDTGFHHHRFPHVLCKYHPDLDDSPILEEQQLADNATDGAILEGRYAGRAVVQPEPGRYTPPIIDISNGMSVVKTRQRSMPEKLVDLERDYANRGLQVIVKLINIHLTPEKPKYKGELWHVEGQLNEHICASAMYYYDKANITPSHLAFRQQSSTGLSQFQLPGINELGEHEEWLMKVFGCDFDDSGIQEVGTVDTLEGRLLVWPNILQHRANPFQLADLTKPGHQKILALYLVDPNIRVISTANVPCQRRDWWSNLIRQGDSAITTLPIEIQDLIFREAEEFPIGLEEAKDLRIRLLEERTSFEGRHDEAFNHGEFFCLN
ncbi:hypothetical protein FPV67DRAFT_292644 [Lyophyllum atratum]|nr:hypothetical protein FPV67DRAFT_292644 [Lyophyllum atratum]